MKEEDMAREAIAKHAKKSKAMVTEENFANKQCLRNNLKKGIV